MGGCLRRLLTTLLNTVYPYVSVHTFTVQIHNQCRRASQMSHFASRDGATRMPRAGSLAARASVSLASKFANARGGESRGASEDDVVRAVALAKASYRRVLRATLGLRDDDDVGTGTGTKIAPLSARARGVLADRVAALARDDARRCGKDASTLDAARASRLAALSAFTSKCVVATAFFRRAHSDPGSEEAAHARVAVGYLDGARRREKRLSPDGGGGGGASKKSKLLGGIRGEVQRAWSGVLNDECAAFTGFTASLIPSDSDFHSD